MQRFALLIPPMLATFPIHPNLLVLITLIIFGEEYKNKGLQYAVFPSLLR
jgi:hypothetical protein